MLMLRVLMAPGERYFDGREYEKPKRNGGGGALQRFAQELHVDVILSIVRDFGRCYVDVTEA